VVEVEAGEEGEVEEEQDEVVEVEAGEDEEEVKEEQDEEDEDTNDEYEYEYIYEHGFTDTDGDTNEDEAEEDEDENARDTSFEAPLKQAMSNLQHFPFLYGLAVRPPQNLVLPPSYALEANLHRFVDLLESHRKVKLITLGRIDQFTFEQDNADSAGEDDVEEQGDRNDEAARRIQRAPDLVAVDCLLERLFGSVVPCQVTIHTMNFDGCLSRSIKRFAAAFPAATGPLRVICFSNLSLEPSCTQVVPGMF
jgi:hypothetical protein